MITIEMLWASMPRDVQRKISNHDLKRITDNYNAKLPKENKGLPDPEDSWAQVELYRWQHGELPPQDKTCKELNESVAIRCMADSIEVGCMSGGATPMPTPFSVCSVLRYMAKKIKT